MTTIEINRGCGSRAVVTSDAARWFLVFGLAVLCFVVREEHAWLVTYPDRWILPVADWVNQGMTWFVGRFRDVFRAISWLLGQPMYLLQSVLQGLPWPAVLALFAIVSHRAGGWGLAAFTTGALLYTLLIGYWSESMNTLALVGVSVPLSVAMGFGLGVMGYRWPRFDRPLGVALDLMQTVPAFAYLIPILLLFGFGPVVGLVASIIYAAPPMVKNTMLGLRSVPTDLVESGKMSGCTRRQLFWNVEFPAALRQIMVGINQTTMAALSMVIIAAIIGGFNDIGWEVLTTMRKAQFGQSLLSGLVIALLAMMLDRISRGFAFRDCGPLPRSRRRGYGHLVVALSAVLLLLSAAALVPEIRTYPHAWTLSPAAFLNEGVNFVLREYGAAIETTKNALLFYGMMPFRIGLSRAITPFTWGFEMSAEVVAVYLALVVLVALGCYRCFGWRGVIPVTILGTVIFYGTTAIPWPAFMAVIALLAFEAGGWSVMALALLSMAFVLVTGLWAEAMLSLYLSGLAVLICCVLGGALGIWAAHSDRVSAILKPINDALQTMPQFALLIPVLMFFQVGELTALIAIVIYAIVPAIRYVEHGLRTVPLHALEAARQVGCTRRQILLEVKIPLAMPVIMLGLNQTIMYALSMLVIAALVGTRDLGQQIYLALAAADAGQGFVAGLSIALIAIGADRIIQAWSRKRRAALGLAV
jgi:glycine betaine/proline transport system permease protein